MSCPNSDTGRCQAMAEGPRNQTWAIFLISALSLFLEMLLIRWIGTEIRIFAYLQNTVLIVCFLGLGMGCFTCRRPARGWHILAPLMAFTAVLAVPFTRIMTAQITDMLSVLDDLLIWFNSPEQDPVHTALRVTLGLSLTFLLMVLLWEMFVPLGRLLGRYMNDCPSIIWAYSVNVAGSLAGIALFVLASAFELPPVAWFLGAAMMLLGFVGVGRERLLNLGLIAATIIAAWLAGREPGAIEVAWSPYQKLALSKGDPHRSMLTGEYLITVNNIGYQGMLNLSDQGVRSNPAIAPETYGLSQYDVPLRLHPRPDRVLIVGAGAGNDAAGALRGGARQVTAVEIDPAIIDMGRRYHPERPYDSPRVKIINDDARSFFATTVEKFDVIIFGLLDSHTTTAMTNARLDHYVYTRESIRRARSLLDTGGVMVLTFEARKQYIADRMARCLKEEFGTTPLVFRIPSSASGWGGVMFVTGDQQAIRASLAEDRPLATAVEAWQAKYPIELSYATRVTSDDWPYIYLANPRIPTLYLLLGGLMIGLLAYAKLRLGLAAPGIGGTRSHWHFFFLGAAFLLLEVQNISKCSVVLGNTWAVNAIVVAAILLMILLANLVEAKGPRLQQNVVTLCLIATCLALYLIDLSRFGFLPYALKASVVGGLTTLPMFFSGIVFIRSFANVKRKDLALGANLIGALMGGLLQSLTFVIGVKALLLVVAGLYLAAMFTREKQSCCEEAFEEYAGKENVLTTATEWASDMAVEWGETKA